MRSVEHGTQAEGGEARQRSEQSFMQWSLEDEGAVGRGWEGLGGVGRAV